MTPGARSVLIAGAAISALLFAAVPVRAQAGGRVRPTTRALLSRGSETVKGLPNFGRNALPALYGEYRIERVDGPDAQSHPDPRVWMTMEALYLSPSNWSPVRAAGRNAYASARTETVDGVDYRYFLFDRPFVADGQGAEPRRWSVIAALPQPGGDASTNERFLSVFLERLAYFLSNARSPTDASFPAVLEW